jgi:hypothetical protein
MPPFTQEQKCTDGSTDAYIFRPSVHPTLYKCVGPTIHNGSAMFLSPNPNPLRAAAVHRAPSSSPPLAKSRAPVPPPQPSVPAAGSSRSPPAAAPLLRVLSRARASSPSDLGFRRAAESGRAPPRLLAGIPKEERKGPIFHHSHSSSSITALW